MGSSLNLGLFLSHRTNDFLRCNYKKDPEKELCFSELPISEA